jgi:hypothetical protein
MKKTYLDLLPFDVQKLIWYEVHRLYFPIIMEELLLMVEVFEPYAKYSPIPVEVISTVPVICHQWYGLDDLIVPRWIWDIQGIYYYHNIITLKKDLAKYALNNYNINSEYVYLSQTALTYSNKDSLDT